MKIRLAIVVLVVAGLAFALVYQRRQSPFAKQEKLVEQFITILPDTLSNDHILEIRHLFYVMRERTKSGAVKPETLAEITRKLEGHVEHGRITASSLVTFMAEVGYATYKDDPRYNLSDGSVDHPVLNPEASMVKMRFDSTQYDSAFWAEYKEFEKLHGEEFSDSASGPVGRTPGRR
jgi:hypothetical protein